MWRGGIIFQEEERGALYPKGHGYWLMNKETYRPDFLLHARETNDGMAKYAASKIADAMEYFGVPIEQAKIAILGLTTEESDDMDPANY